MPSEIKSDINNQFNHVRETFTKTLAHLVPASLALSHALPASTNSTLKTSWNSATISTVAREISEQQEKPALESSRHPF